MRASIRHRVGSIRALGKQLKGEVAYMLAKRRNVGHYQEFLYGKGLLDGWSKFEAGDQNKAIIEWAESKGFKVDVHSVETTTKQIATN